MEIMTSITLLGDSIIDNKTYVQQQEYSVLEHLQNISKYEFLQLAYDGDTTVNVLERQLQSQEVAKSSHLVLSIGGNDLLQNILFLHEGPIENINKALSDVHKQILKPLEQRFGDHCGKVIFSQGESPFITVYEGIWEELMNLEMY